MGEAFCGCSPALRLHLQQQPGPRGARRPQPLHSTGGIQRRPAGHAYGLRQDRERLDVTRLSLMRIHSNCFGARWPVLDTLIDEMAN